MHGETVKTVKSYLFIYLFIYSVVLSPYSKQFL